MIDIQQDALRPFEQDPIAALAGGIERAPDGLGKGQDKVCNFAQIVEQAIAIDRRLVEPGPQCVMMRAQPIELRFQVIEMREVAHPDRPPPGLVFISGANAAAGCANLAFAARIFAQAIQIAMDRQDERAGLGNLQGFRGHIDTLAAQLVDLVTQRPGIEHHAIADH